MKLFILIFLTFSFTAIDADQSTNNKKIHSYLLEIQNESCTKKLVVVTEKNKNETKVIAFGIAEVGICKNGIKISSDPRSPLNLEKVLEEPELQEQWDEISKNKTNEPLNDHEKTRIIVNPLEHEFLISNISPKIKFITIIDSSGKVINVVLTMPEKEELSIKIPSTLDGVFKIVCLSESAVVEEHWVVMPE